MKIAICYFSATDRTKSMAEAIAAGILEQEPGCEVRCLSITDVTKENTEAVEFVNSADGVLVGTPDYYAGEAWQVKQWLDVCPCKVAGKLCGAFATANFAVGGPVVAVEHILTHLMVQGAMVYSGGGAYGQPFIHLGPVCLRDQETEGAALMKTFGQRFVQQVKKIFG